jgi:serine/threonine protein kinase
MSSPPDLPEIAGITFTSDVREGGQAIVARATDAEGNAVAVKISRHEPAAKRALENEIKALVDIHNTDSNATDWLVAVHGHGILPDGRPYVVLPWLPHSLLSWLAAHEPSMVERFDALVQAAGAVARLHATGSLHQLIVHRDLKPANFLVSTEPELRVRLADLGTVKTRTFRASTHNTVLFTPVYAPPEQRLPLDRPLDPSVDVHALGVLGFQVVTGSLPQTATQRTGYRLPAGDELLALHASEDTLPEPRLARLRALRAMPLSTFYDIDEAPDLLDEDRTTLHKALRGALSLEAATEATDLLTEAIARSLRADPDRRSTSARELLAAFVSCRTLAGASPSTALDRLIAPVLTDVPRATPPRRTQRRVPTPVLIGGGIALGVGLTLGALWFFWPRTEALTPQEAAELGMDTDIAGPRMSLRYTGDPEAYIVFGGLRSRGNILRSQTLAAGQHKVLVRSDDNKTLGELLLTVSPHDTGWSVEVESQRGTARTGAETFILKPGELLALSLQPDGVLRRSRLMGG